MCTSGLEGLMSGYKRLKLPLYLRGWEVHCVQVDLRNAAYGYDSSCALVEGGGSSGSSSSSIPRHLSLESVCWSVFVYGSHIRPGFAPPQNQGVLGMEVRASEDDTEMVKCEGGDDNDYDDLDEEEQEEEQEEGNEENAFAAKGNKRRRKKRRRKEGRQHSQQHRPKSSMVMIPLQNKTAENVQQQQSVIQQCVDVFSVQGNLKL